MLTGEHIRRIVEGVSSKEDVDVLIFAVHEMALRYLQIKRRKGLLEYLLSSQTIDDLAWDCIAPLFERNEAGQLICFCNSAFFNVLSINSMPEEELQTELRKFIFQRINDELFDLYKKNDHSLALIIRNIKAVVNQCDEASIEKRNGVAWVVVGKELSSGYEIIPPEFLLLRLTPRSSGISDLTTKKMIELTCQIIFEQTQYANGVPLTELALIFRQVRKLLHLPDSEDSADPFIETIDLEKLISETVSFLDSKYRQEYVGKGKVSLETWKTYLKCICDILSGTYDVSSTYQTSFYKYLRNYRTDLTLEAYTSSHRTYLEYLVKNARNLLIHTLKKDLDFGENGKPKGYSK